MLDAFAHAVGVQRGREEIPRYTEVHGRGDLGRRAVWSEPPEHQCLAMRQSELKIFNCGGYGSVRSSPVLARKPSMRPGRYCIGLSRALIDMSS